MKSNKDLVDYLVERKILKTPRIIEAFRAIDRAGFVLPEYLGEAYENHPLPIGENQTISQPETVAFMFEKLDPKPGEKILDIGSGSGWTTALLAEIVMPQGSVLGIERVQSLALFGQKNLKKFDFGGIARIIAGDGTEERMKEGPFDKILASAEARGRIPEEWKRELKTGGKIVAPIDGSIMLLTKKNESEWEEKKFPGFAFVPLVSNEQNSEKNMPEKAQFRKTKSGKGIIGIFAIAAGIGILGMLNEIYYPHPSFEGRKRIAIPQGAGSRVIGAHLKTEGIVRSKWVFVTYVFLRNKASDLKPGEYTFFSDMNIPEVANDLIRGGATEILLTVPEGWTAADIAKKLESEKVTTLQEFLNAAGYPNTDYRVDQKLPPPETHADTFSSLADKPWYVGFEGYLFPDTYRIFRDSKPQEIIEKMLENLNKKLTPDLREEIARQKKSIFSIITIASLIEKEVRTDEDRAVVSGILWKRIEREMPLQVDATINYITGGNNPSVTREETKIDSPYNTYLYPGLPLGPISNPGLSAIQAAIYPKKSPYLFYLSTPEGKTIFSRTLDEHNAAKRKYLR